MVTIFAVRLRHMPKCMTAAKDIEKTSQTYKSIHILSSFIHVYTLTHNPSHKTSMIQKKFPATTAGAKARMQHIRTIVALYREKKLST